MSTHGHGDALITIGLEITQLVKQITINSGLNFHLPLCILSPIELVPWTGPRN